jgi:hypothetical protein
MNYVLLIICPNPRPDPSAGIVGLILGFWAANLLGVTSAWSYIGLCVLGMAISLTWFVQSGIAACVIAYLFFTGYWG